MWIAGVELDLLLGDVRSLKQKRSAVRPLIAELRRRFAVAVAETGDPELLRRAVIGVAAVSGEARHALDVIDEVERLVADRSEFDLLAARRRVFSADDDFGAAVE